MKAIDKALALNVEARPQSIPAWRGDLLAPDPVRASWLTRTTGGRKNRKKEMEEAEPVAPVAAKAPAAAAAPTPPPPDAPVQKAACSIFSRACARSRRPTARHPLRRSQFRSLPRRLPLQR